MIAHGQILPLIDIKSTTTTTDIINRANERDLAMGRGRPQRESTKKADITQQALETLKEQAAAGTQATRDLTKMTTDNQKILADKEELERKLQTTLKLLEEERRRGSSTNGHIIITPKLPRKKAKKAELNQDLLNHVIHVSKTWLFRNVKFIESEEEEKKHCKKIIKQLPVEIGMPEEEFIDKYSPYVYQAIKDACQAVQSNTKKRAKGMYCLQRICVFCSN